MCPTLDPQPTTPGTNPLVQVSPSIAAVTVSPSLLPSVAADPTAANQAPSDPEKSSGNNNGLAGILLKLILQILAFLLQLISGGNR